jgi:hypothetical protein
MNEILRAYTSAGITDPERMLEHARLRGEASYRQVLRAIMEGPPTKPNSTAMVVVPGEPPGKNVCGFVRNLVGSRTKVIVAAQQGSLAPGQFERLLRASMPDCEKKLRVMDCGPSIADAVSSAERNRHYAPSQALEVFAPKAQTDAFTQEVQGGSLQFDPTVIMVTPSEIPTDDVEGIRKAVQGEDLAAMHRVLDPHVFSDQNALQKYKDAIGGSAVEGKLHEATRQQNFMASEKLGGFPWRDTGGLSVSPEIPDEGQVVFTRKDLPKFDPSEGQISCVIVLLPMVEFSARTRRGNPNTPGWMIDCEILVQGMKRGQLRWIYHVEKRFPDRETAEQYRERLKAFVDTKTLIELEKMPKSGKISMSKFEGLMREFLTDIAPTRELGIKDLDSLLRHELGDSFADLEYLGSGRNGSAYRTPDGLILKVTTDRNEVDSAARLRGVECEYIHRIHEVLFTEDPNVWIIVQEGGLEKLPSEYCEEFDLAMEIIETIGAGRALREGDAQQVKEIMVRSGHPELCQLVAEVMRKFDVGGMLREISELGLSADFHSGNIMLREGKPVLTDLGTPGDDPGEQKGPPDGDLPVNELAGVQAAPQAGPRSQMRGSNSSAWAGGKLVLSKPEQHVPEDENENERTGALDQDIQGGGLDWGIGLSRRGY